MVLAALPSAADEIAISHSGKVWIVDTETGEQRELAQTGYDRPLTWSPDGAHLIYWKHSAIGWDLWRTDPDGSEHTNLTEVTSGGCRSAAYSPDGSRIAYMRDNPAGVYIMSADGSDKQHLTVKGHRDDAPVWSGDGRFIAFTYLGRGGTPGAQETVAVVPATSDLNRPDTVRFERQIGEGGHPSFSADSTRVRWLMPHGSRMHIVEVSITLTEDALPGAHPLAQREVWTLDKHALDATWSPDGATIAYWARSGDAARPYELRIAPLSLDGEQSEGDEDDQFKEIIIATATAWRGPASLVG